MKIKLDEDAILPVREHELDAGLDIFSREDKLIPPESSACFDTGLHIELPVNTVGFIKSRSGLNIKNDITSEGVIDSGYTGSIVVKLYNHGKKPYMVHRGDKISQLVIFSILAPKIEVVDKLEETERGENGFGSTGR